MSDFRTTPHIPEGVEPGFADLVVTQDAESIRARNVACTPTVVWHFKPEFVGVSGGETGV